MLSRSQRLSVEQLNAVMEKGRVAHSSLFLLRTLGGQKDTRIAAIAPQKIIKTATARNALRRKVYTATRSYVTNLKPGLHTALFAKSAAAQATLVEIQTNLSELFVKAGLLR
jgi:ribonuclease P protein component